MKRYANRTRESGVTHYELGEDWIEVRFSKSAQTYRYSTGKIGAKHLREMKRLAKAGQGLATYISQHPDVRDGYD